MSQSTPRPRWRRILLLLSSASLSLAACGYEPARPELHYTLSADTQTKLQGDGASQAQILGALGMLFGSPANPSYAALKEWEDEEFDPNHPTAHELSEERVAELEAANARAWGDQLAHIATGEFEKVRPPREALDMVASWKEIRAGFDELRKQVAAGTKTKADLDQYVKDKKQEAAALFEHWYPSLRESAELYRQQCLHCHGVNGGADGSTAPFLNPRPRNYQQGKFKWTALKDKRKPRRADLYHVIENGVNGTAMLSFKRFSPTQLEGLVDYVRMLAVRGETEILLAMDVDPEVGLKPDQVESTYKDVWEKWGKSQSAVIAFAGEVPRPTPERVAHGKKLYLDANGANCVKCHGQLGRGDGDSAYDHDSTGKQVQVKDEWGNPILPRDLTSGIYRGGNRLIDIYRRLYASINGTAMPAHFGMQMVSEGRPMSEDDIWDLVHYVRSLAAQRRM